MATSSVLAVLQVGTAPVDPGGSGLSPQSHLVSWLPLCASHMRPEAGSPSSALCRLCSAHVHLGTPWFHRRQGGVCSPRALATCPGGATLCLLARESHCASACRPRGLSGRCSGLCGGHLREPRPGALLAHASPHSSQADFETWKPGFLTGMSQELGMREGERV